MGSTSTITINTNLSSLICQKYLRDATTGMNAAMEKLSTGFKINSGKDDAAGYSVVEGMQAKINGYDVIETNASMGLDMLTTQEGVLDILNEYLQRIRDLTMQAANGTYGSASLNAIKIEVVQRMEEINRLCKITDFNDMYLLDGSRTEDINLQVGLYSDKNCVITMDAFLFKSCEVSSLMGFFSDAKTGGMIDMSTMPATDAAALEAAEAAGYIYRARVLDAEGKPQYENGQIKYKGLCYNNALAAALAETGAITDGNPATITSQKETLSIEEMCTAIYRNDQSAREFITNIDAAIDNVSLRVTEIGAYMNRLESAIESTDVQRESLTQSISTLKDTDVAKESSNYIKYQILQQSAATLLSTANQQPQIALNLL